MSKKAESAAKAKDPFWEKVRVPKRVKVSFFVRRKPGKRA